MAQSYAGRLVVSRGSKNLCQAGEYHEVDVSTLELLRPRSIGVEHVGLEALRELGLPEILANAGLNDSQQAAALGNIIGRMAVTGR